MPIILKTPRIKSFRYLGKARAPINTFTSFFDSPPKLGKKKIVKEVIVASHEEPQVEARDAQPNSRWSDTPARTKAVKIKIKGKKKKIDGVQVIVREKYGSTNDRSENAVNYGKRLNFNFVSKKYYGRFTQNPRQTGRRLVPVSNELTETEE
jgi:hypothetical protein